MLAIAWLTLLDACARMPDPGVTPLKPVTLDELKGQLLNPKADLDQFRLRGPFAVTVQKGHEVHLSTTERIEADRYLSATVEKAPLVIRHSSFRGRNSPRTGISAEE